MKRIGNLTENIADLGNLYLAFYKASKSKQKKYEVSEYRKSLYNNLRLLRQQILSGKVQIGHYKYFTIYEPKERIICAASFPERVLHHAIINVCHKYFENKQIYDSYATRKNKGTYKALERAKYFSKHYKYYLKLDIRKYFDSIDHTLLNKKLETIFKDLDLLYIFYQIIDSYHTKNGKGLPIGNLTSQYFANFYLSYFDRLIKQNLRIKPYVRYMDDMIIWDNNPKYLNRILIDVEQFLQQTLLLNFKIKQINTTAHGLNFLSYRIFHNHIEVQQKSKKRFIKKLEIFEYKLSTGAFSPKEYQNHVLPLLAFTEHASSKGFRKKVFGY